MKKEIPPSAIAIAAVVTLVLVLFIGWRVINPGHPAPKQLTPEEQQAKQEAK